MDRPESRSPGGRCRLGWPASRCLGPPGDRGSRAVVAGAAHRRGSWRCGCGHGARRGHRGSWTVDVRVEAPVGAATASRPRRPAVVTGTPRLRVAATLPAYPAVVPGDVVVEGSIRPRPRPATASTSADRGGRHAQPDADRRAAPWIAHVVEGVRRPARAPSPRPCPSRRRAWPPGSSSACATASTATWRRRSRRPASATSSRSRAGTSRSWPRPSRRVAGPARAAGARSVVTMVAIVGYVVFAGASRVGRPGRRDGGGRAPGRASAAGRAGRRGARLGGDASCCWSDPGLVGDAGFQLSALATAGLIAWATPLTAAIERLGRGRLPGWLAESLGGLAGGPGRDAADRSCSFGRLAIVAPRGQPGDRARSSRPAMAAGPGGAAGRRAGRRRLPPPIVGAVLAAPAWVLARG